MYTQRYYRLVTLLAPTVVACDTNPTHVKGIGSHQYVANKFIEDRVAHQIVAGKRQLVTVMDGHGGPQVAEYMTRELPGILSSELGSGKSIREALTASFRLADARWFDLVHPAYQLGFTGPIKVGACAIAVVIDDSHITVASVGDCKCVLARESEPANDLNIERNANREEEQARLRQLHPGEEDVVKCRRSWTEEVSKNIVKKFHSGCYVKGRLQPTKSFGDFHLKDSRVDLDPERNRSFLDPTTPRSYPYIDADPDVTVTKRSAADRFLIAATDGLWDQFSSQEAVVIVEAALKAGLTPNQASVELVEAALQRAATNHRIPIGEMKLLPPGSSRRSIHDDISVCIVIL